MIRFHERARTIDRFIPDFMMGKPVVTEASVPLGKGRDHNDQIERSEGGIN